MNNNLHNDDNDFKDVSDRLRSLKKVNAKPGFEADLMRRINSEKFAPEKKGNIFSLMFSKLILFPAAGFAVLFIAVALFQNDSTNSTDPWSDMIKERPDVYAVSNNETIPADSFMQDNEAGKTNDELASADKKSPETKQTPGKTPDTITEENSGLSSFSATGKPSVLDSLQKENSAPLMFKSSSVNKQELDSLKNRIFKRDQE